MIGLILGTSAENTRWLRSVLIKKLTITTPPYKCTWVCKDILFEEGLWQIGQMYSTLSVILYVRITVRIIAWASEKDITNVQRMRITRSFRWLELLKSESCDISAKDLQKPFREFKNRNSFLWTNTGVTNMLTLPHDEVFGHLRNPVKK